MKTPSYFGRFLVRPLKDGRTWAMGTIFGFSSRTGIVVQIPVGRTSDFASIPRPVWPLIPPIGKHGPAAWIHDELYWAQWTTREEADRVFREAMEFSGVGMIARATIYRAVRLFGGFAWRANARAKAAGVTRLVDLEADVFLAGLDGGDVGGMA